MANLYTGHVTSSLHSASTVSTFGTNAALTTRQLHIHDPRVVHASTLALFGPSCFTSACLEAQRLRHRRKPTFRLRFQPVRVWSDALSDKDLLLVFSVSLLLTIATATLALLSYDKAAGVDQKSKGRSLVSLIPNLHELGWDDLLEGDPEVIDEQDQDNFDPEDDEFWTPIRGAGLEYSVPSLGISKAGLEYNVITRKSLEKSVAEVAMNSSDTSEPETARVSLALAASAETLPPQTKIVWALISPYLHTSADKEFHRTLLFTLASIVADAVHFWRRKEAMLLTLSKLGADSDVLAAALVFDIDSEFGIPWETVRAKILDAGMSGAAVATLADEKRSFGQMTSLFYLRTLRSMPSGEEEHWTATAQLLRQLSLQVTLALAEQTMIAEASPAHLSSKAVRALARSALDFHAPLAQLFGGKSANVGLADRDGVPESKRSVGLLPLPYCWNLSGSLEHLGLWLLYPGEYRVVVDWFDREYGLLDRTLSHGIDVIRAALAASPRFRASSKSYKLNSRVKTPQSLMKKLLRGQNVNDLLGMELIIEPMPVNSENSDSEVPAETLAEIASCFSAAEAIQRFASRASLGWTVAPGSFKNYISRPKKSGYQAIHLTLVTDMFASPLRPTRRTGQIRGDNEGGEDTAIVQRAPCQLELHIFSVRMKAIERYGPASHGSYKAFPLRPKALMEALESDVDKEGAISVTSVADHAFRAVSGASDVLSNLADGAGFDAREGLQLSDLQESRRKVDATMAEMQLALDESSASSGLGLPGKENRELPALPAPSAVESREVLNHVDGSGGSDAGVGNHASGVADGVAADDDKDDVVGNLQSCGSGIFTGSFGRSVALARTYAAMSADSESEGEEDTEKTKSLIPLVAVIVSDAGNM
eukprot:TRINITY_DN33711_c0_g1_i3.p1 TRINITY_DN33711_c0_g1~~TRINITY_DN33711_c0_g1_i3.p1  ORF type:complete len:880 (-),score=164.48 TRINITY_DN33711_c0_g1_i3:28-2667(-)